MQYLAGSKGVSIPSGIEIELAYDTCSESQYVWVRVVAVKGIVDKTHTVKLKNINFTQLITSDFQGA